MCGVVVGCNIMWRVNEWRSWSTACPSCFMLEESVQYLLNRKVVGECCGLAWQNDMANCVCELMPDQQDRWLVSSVAGIWSQHPLRESNLGLQTRASLPPTWFPSISPPVPSFLPMCCCIPARARSPATTYRGCCRARRRPSVASSGRNVE